MKGIAMSKLGKILVIGLVLLAGAATTASLTLSDSNNSELMQQMACEGCESAVGDGGG